MDKKNPAASLSQSRRVKFFGHRFQVDASLPNDLMSCPHSSRRRRA